VLHAIQDEGMQIEDIAWHHKRGYLPCSLRQQLIPASPAFKNDEEGPGAISLPYQISAGWDVIGPAASRHEERDVFLGQ
jgi:hypothetical protein